MNSIISKSVLQNSIHSSVLKRGIFSKGLSLCTSNLNSLSKISLNSSSLRSNIPLKNTKSNSVLPLSIFYKNKFYSIKAETGPEDNGDYPKLDFQLVPAGLLNVNCVIISDDKSKEALIVDPGGDSELLLNILEKSNLKLKGILLTHAHFDHVMGVGKIKSATNCKVYLHKDDMYLWKNLPEQMKGFGLKFKEDEKLPDSPDVFIKEGDEIKIDGKSIAKVLHTPGHSLGSVSYYFKKENLIIVGDTIFKESVGRCDLWGGNDEQLRTAIKKKIYTLPDTTKIIPGHGPTTNIGYEKKENLYVY